MSQPTAEPVFQRPIQAAALFGLAWLAGAFSCRYLGVWAGVGGIALLTGSFCWIRHRKALAHLFHVNAGLISLGVIFGATMSVATYLLYPVFSGWVPGLSSSTAELYSLFNQGQRPLRLALLPFVIMCEELVWRGLVQTVLERRFGKAIGIAAAALIYAVAHLPAATPLLALIALCCGLYWSTIRAATGSLVPTLIAHLIWDVLIMVVAPLTN